MIQMALAIQERDPLDIINDPDGWLGYSLVFNAEPSLSLSAGRDAR
jgi:hypothetical protein